MEQNREPCETKMNAFKMGTTWIFENSIPVAVYTNVHIYLYYILIFLNLQNKTKIQYNNIFIL